MTEHVDHPFVAMSVSKPEEVDLVRHGVSATHLQVAYLELSRHLLASGYALASGGDLRLLGFTDRLLDLVRSYRAPGEPSSRSAARSDEVRTSGKRVRIYLADFVHDGATDDALAGAHNLAEIVRVSRSRSEAEVGGESAAAANAQSMSEMRRRVTGDCVARVVIGGRLFGAIGRTPGVLEEAWWSISTQQALFVVGGFGGVGALIGDMLVDPARVKGRVDALSRDEHYVRVSHELAAVLPTGLPIDGASMLVDIARGGFDGLHNGLDAADNYRLLSGVDVSIDEIIGLILRGLVRVRDRPTD